MQKIRWTHLFWCLIAAAFMALTLLGMKLILTRDDVMLGVLMLVCGVASVMLFRSYLRVLDGKTKDNWLDRTMRAAHDTW